MNPQIPQRCLIALACLAPTLLAYNQTPAATLYNQLLSLVLWGAALLLLDARAGLRRSSLPVLLALGLLCVAVLCAALVQASIQEVSALGLLGAAAGVYLLGAGSSAPQQSARGEGLAMGCLLVGLLGTLIGVIQVFAPSLPDGSWIARSGFVGRAVGNVRQPNHLATLLLLAAVGLIWLAQHRDWRPVPVGVGMAVLVTGVLLSASRTGLWGGIPLLFLWGLLDAQLKRRWRVLLLGTPLIAALAWLGLHWWAASGLGVFGAETRLDQEGAGSPSRIKILLNAWSLLQQHPWTGVGWGGFNRAWTLSPFPDRPVAFFDHSHNLPLQLLVELGWPLGGAVLLLLLLGFGLGARLAWRARGAEALMRRAALMMVLIIGLHSQTEYPLWYAYFLLPAALAFGLLLAPAPAQTVSGRSRLWPRLLGLVLVAASAYAFHEYRKVVAIYAPAADAAPLAQRVEAGQRTLLFGRHADYAAATSLGVDASALAAAQRTGWQLIDARLLIAWAKNLDAAGETDKARFMVARLREFRSREGDAWLAACETGPDAAWFCAPPERHYNWREF